MAPMLDPQRWARDRQWEPVAIALQRLTIELDAWAAVVLVPVPFADVLRCAAHYGLPEDWASVDNRLDSGGMNARAILTNSEVIDNDGEYPAPPTNEPLSAHVITSSAVVLVPNVGTLEVLANADGYRFEEEQLQIMRRAARSIATIAQSSV